MIRLVLLGLAAVVVALQAPTGARQGEWFVAPGGAGNGSPAAPFGSIQDALRVAHPGETITVRPGRYTESLQTVRAGAADAPIRLRGSGPRGSAVVSSSGRVLTVSHPHLTVERLVFDGQYGTSDTVVVRTSGHFLRLHDVEVARSSRDLIDMAAPRGVVIEHSLLHRALNPRNGRSDAHGIAAGAVHDLTIRDTEIHTFSGDGIQVDPGRSAPGWSGVTIERCRIWLAPLAEVENGFAAGVVPGENGIDTKAHPALPRATITIRDTELRGFRDGLVSNMAALNLKEHVDVTIDGLTVSDSVIAFRLRGPTSSTPAGAWVAIRNAVVHNVSTAFRYENDIEKLSIWNSTIGRDVTRVFRAASSNSRGLDVRNLLVLGSLPSEAAHPSNLSAGPDAFVNAAGHDYRLAPGTPAIDAGVTLPDVTTDRVGTPRPQGKGYDVGAYEAIAGGRLPIADWFGAGSPD